MWQRVKFVAFLLCVFPIVTILLGSMVASHQTVAPPSAITHAELRASQTRAAKPVTLIPLALSSVAAVIMLIDAFRREYDGPKAWAVAIAIMGLISFGMMSAIYYIGWGYLPVASEGVRATEFCQRCIGQTIDKPARGVGTHNGIGGRLIGNAEACEICGSKIKTYWLTFILPLIPLASYRVLPVGKPTVIRSWFLSRKLRVIYWSQVWPNIAIVVALLLLVLYFEQLH